MELMIVLVLAAVILALGAPNFIEFRRNNRMTAVANELLGAIQTARSEAIKRQMPVAVCPSDNPQDTGATCTDGPFRGWIAFVDPDNDCLRDAANPDEEVVRTGLRIDGEADHPLTPVSNGNCVSFGANGFLQTSPGPGYRDLHPFLRRARQSQAGKHGRLRRPRRDDHADRACTRHAQLLRDRHLGRGMPRVRIAS
jgi:Tfp pilus assembly protein FimT